jgi:hypothetical protein
LTVTPFISREIVFSEILLGVPTSVAFMACMNPPSEVVGAL